MLLKFNRALLIDGHTYQPGVIDVPEAKVKHPHFAKYIKVGSIVPPEASEVEDRTETAAERAERFLAKEKEMQAKREELLKKVDPPVPVEDIVPAPPVEDIVPAPPVEDIVPAPPVAVKPAEEVKKYKKG